MSVLFLGCFEKPECPNRTKDSADMSKYIGTKLISRKTDWHDKAPVGAYIHTFRYKDSVWSESYMIGVFAEFKEGEIIK